MDEKIRQAIFTQIANEPFGKKFGLTLIEVQEGFAKVEMTSAPPMSRENFWPPASRWFTRWTNHCLSLRIKTTLESTWRNQG